MKLSVAAIAPIALILGACVTINIYFPAAAAEKAADKIIEDIWQQDQAQKGAPKANAAPAQPAPDKEPK